MNPQNLDLSVIIVNTNTRELVCQCLNSIYSAPPRCSFEMIVVDNASTDGSREAIELQYPEVRLIRNSQNVGFSVANNRALAVARGEHLLLLNSDTIIPPGSLDQMLLAMRSDARLGVISPRLVYGDGSLQLSYGPMPGLFVAFCRFFELRRLVPRSLLVSMGRSWVSRALGKKVGTYATWFGHERLPTREVDSDHYVSGACMFIRRTCYEAIGPLDPNYFMYVDDADYSKRVHDAGWRILYLSEVTIIHLQAGTVGRRYRRTAAPAYQSMLYFLKKHHGSWAFHVSKMFAVAAVFGRWAGNALMRRKERKQLWGLLTELATYHAPD
jgi:hypothetical protein